MNSLDDLNEDICDELSEARTAETTFDFVDVPVDSTAAWLSSDWTRFEWTAKEDGTDIHARVFYGSDVELNKKMDEFKKSLEKFGDAAKSATKGLVSSGIEPENPKT